MKITVHCLVKNEENFIWFAINSALPFVEKIFVWDTGSTDKTVQIVKSIKNPKIEFEEKGGADAETLVRHRQEMIDKTQTDWMMILDGDEIWWEGGIREVVTELQSYRVNYDLVVNPCYMAIGDVFHYQEEAAGRYKIHDKVGHLNIRFIRNFPGLKVEGVYPNEAFKDAAGKKLQNFPKKRILFSEDKYLHLSRLVRSSKEKKNFKYEWGIPFPKDFYYPEVFFQPRPRAVPSPWRPITDSYKLIAGVQTPLKKIKRMTKRFARAGVFVVSVV